MPLRVKIDLSEINDGESFHGVFIEAMGFPEFYRRNMDAWIDCMSYIDDPEAGMSSLTVKPGETLEIELQGTEKLISIRAKIFQEFLLCTAFVNQRFIETGSQTRIALISM
jgi:hypothetical protein